MAPGCRAEEQETALNLSSDYNDRFEREPFLKDNFVVAGVLVRSGNADLIASRTPVRSAVQVHCVPGENDFLKEVTDSSAVVSELGALLTRRNAGRPCHVPRTADVDGELLFPGAGANPRFCCDRAAPGGGNDRLPGVGPDLRLRCDFAAPAVSAAVLLAVGANSRHRRERAAPAGCAADLFGAGAHSRLRRDFARFTVRSSFSPSPRSPSSCWVCQTFVDR